MKEKIANKYFSWLKKTKTKINKIKGNKNPKIVDKIRTKSKIIDIVLTLAVEDESVEAEKQALKNSVHPLNNFLFSSSEIILKYWSFLDNSIKIKFIVFEHRVIFWTMLLYEVIFEYKGFEFGIR